MKTFTIIIIFILLTIRVSSQATFMGGEVIYQINSPTGNGGTFSGQQHIYYNCSIHSFITINPISMFNYSLSIINSTRYSKEKTTICNGACNHSMNAGSYQNGVYSIRITEMLSGSNIFNPFSMTPLLFIGSPSLNGWVFDATAGERDTNTLVNVLTDTLPYNHPSIWTRVYPFPPTMIPFIDISPRFKNDAVILCTVGDSVNYLPGVIDPDGDSISISFYPLLAGGAGALPNSTWPIGNLPPYIDTVDYAQGYSFTKPMPDTSFNPNNIPASINSQTGEISFCCHNPGNYAIGIRVSSFRNGYPLNDVHREIFVSVFPPDNNHDPKITCLSSAFDTIYAGDSVDIPIVVTDADATDWVYFSATGFPLDSNLDGTGGCSKPPCAYFSTLPPDSFQSAGLGIFHWKTSCNHTAQYQNSVTYNFALSVKDDNCPLPGFGANNISITVIKPPALPAAPLHCASVDSLGNVLLSWSPAVDTTGFSFKKYVVHFSDSLYGTYTALDTFYIINQTSYFHLGVGANSDTLFYVLETISSCNPMHSAFSDTIATLFLSLANSGTGVASLAWNDIRDSLSLGGFYHIYRSINHAPFVLLDSSSFISFVDTISVCSLEVTYYVSLGDSSGCVSRSNLRTSLFEDKIAPFSVAIDTVSLDAFNHPHIAWLTSSSPDVVAYLVYSGGLLVDTILTDSSFFDTSLVVGSSGVCYAVAPMDSCGNMGALASLHCSISLSAKINSCGQSVLISWHPNQDTSLISYQLFYRENGGGEVLLASLGAKDSSFVHLGANSGSSYCYFVRSLLSSGRSCSSNRFCILADFSAEEDYTYLRVATVAGGDLVRLKVQSESSVAVREFIIERRLLNNATFSTIATVPFVGAGIWYFDDASASVNQRSYVYRIISVDSCYRNDTSNMGQSILLSSSSLANNVNALLWNAYGDWQAGVDFYVIHRLLEDVEVFPSIVVPESGAATYSYEDDVTLYADQGSEFCYFIEAIEAPGNSITNSFDTSFSNLSCLLREPNIFIPSAFHPGGGFNDVFKPEIPFIYGNSYSMLIYNRWGQKLFETHDINVGWDGTFKGSDAPPQAYVYLIKLRDAQGNEIVKSGSLVLIR